jgi:hypothetical protein
MLYRNVLKLRQEKKLAKERGESSVTEMVTPPEQRGYWSGQEMNVILSENHAVPPDRKAQADQDDWREVSPPNHPIFASLTFRHLISPSQRSQFSFTNAAQEMVSQVRLTHFMKSNFHC